MRIAVTQRYLHDRIIPLLETFKKTGHEVFNFEGTGCPDSDIWIYGFWQPNFKKPRPYKEKDILKFKGKFGFVSVDDGSATAVELVSPELRRRIDFWIVNNTHPVGSAYCPSDLKNKIILIPIFPIKNRPYNSQIERNNRVIFYGKATGGFNLNGCSNVRIEAIRRVKKMNVPFIGGITGTDCELLKGTFDDVKTDHVPDSELFKLQELSTISLCLPGNEKLTYRHFESMRDGCAIISPRLFNPNRKWLNDDKINEDKCFFIIDDDLDNLESVVLDAFKNRNKQERKILEGLNVYYKYYELSELMTFQPHIFKQIVDQFKNCDINL